MVIIFPVWLNMANNCGNTVGKKFSFRHGQHTYNARLCFQWRNHSFYITLNGFLRSTGIYLNLHHWNPLKSWNEKFSFSLFPENFGFRNKNMAKSIRILLIGCEREMFKTWEDLFPYLFDEFAIIFAIFPHILLRKAKVFWKIQKRTLLIQL
jgi:hypothetical protein